MHQSRQGVWSCTRSRVALRGWECPHCGRWMELSAAIQGRACLNCWVKTLGWARCFWDEEGVAELTTYPGPEGHVPFQTSEQSREKTQTQQRWIFFTFYFIIIFSCCWIFYFLPSSLSTSMDIIYAGPPRVIKPAIPLPGKWEKPALSKFWIPLRMLQKQNWKQLQFIWVAELTIICRYPHPYHIAISVQKYRILRWWMF